MGLFDKKYCDFCGEKIKFLGNRKVEDGNMCTDCAKKISPFMTDRRQTSVVEMKEHLQYREENKNKLSLLRGAQTIGEDSVKLLINRDNRVFAVTRADSGNLEAVNPDVISISDVQYVNVDKKEYKIEEFYKDSQGNRKSYNPRKYKISYDYIVTIAVHNKWFNDISFKVNQNRIESTNYSLSTKYNRMMYEVKEVLSGSTPETSVSSSEKSREERLREAQRFTDPAVAAAEFEKHAAEALMAAASGENSYGNLASMGDSMNNSSVARGRDFLSVAAKAYASGTSVQALNQVYDTGNAPASNPWLVEFARSINEAKSLGVDSNKMKRILMSAMAIESQAKQQGVNPFVIIAEQSPDAKDLYPAQATNSAPVAAEAASFSWNCPYCGKTGLTTNFCSECGAQRPQ